MSSDSLTAAGRRATRLGKGLVIPSCGRSQSRVARGGMEKLEPIKRSLTGGLRRQSTRTHVGRQEASTGPAQYTSRSLPHTTCPSYCSRISASNSSSVAPQKSWW